MVSFRAIVASGALLVLASNIGYADTGVVQGTVSQVLIDDSLFGGCVVALSSDINTELPACSAGWVTLDCLVAFPESSKSIAQNKLSMIQLAMATGKQVRVYVTDSRKANGYCLATRVDYIN